MTARTTTRTRAGRRLTALAGVAFAAALVAGCGGGDEDDAPVTETAQEDADSDAQDDAELVSGEESGSGENLFEGTWGFGHDTKTLSAAELSDLLEDEADARGPEEMSLSVECGDGIDTSTQDYEAECIAYADEGVEHLWEVTGEPADAGLEIEVENVG